MLLDFINSIVDKQQFYYWEDEGLFDKYRPYVIGFLYQLEK